jgi:hypothetical protein
MNLIKDRRGYSLTFLDDLLRIHPDPDPGAEHRAGALLLRPGGDRQGCRCGCAGGCCGDQPAGVRGDRGFTAHQQNLGQRPGLCQHE